MIYSIILKNYSIISDFSEEEGDFQEVLTGILKANKRQNEFYLINYLHYGFFFLHHEELTFACISNKDVDQEKVLLFLNALKNSFLEIYSKEKDNFTFKVTNLMRDLMGQYKDNISNDKFERIEQELKQIEKEKFEIIKQTIDKEMCLDSLISNSENLKRSVINKLTKNSR